MVERCGWLVVGVLLAVAGLSGCGALETGREPGDAVLPASPTPCVSVTPRESEPPTSSKLTYRMAEMADGAVHTTVGDVDAAPEEPDAVRTSDHRAPAVTLDCETVRVEKAHGWWCTTSVESIDVEGEIVVGGAEPRARIGGAGFATRCHERPERMRLVYQIERDSWSGWRAYGEPRYTDWTRAQRQRGEPVWEPCPRGRVGTYNYQLTVWLEIEGTHVGDSPATSAPIRSDCGTGTS